MAVTGTENARALIEAALLDLEAITMGQSVPARMAEHAKLVLPRLIKSWQLYDPAPDFLRVRTATQTLTTATSYTLSPIRPIEIIHVRYKGAGETSTIPMTRMSMDEYDFLPDKTTTGTPTQWMYDRQKESALLYIWPGLSSATTESIEYTYQREFEDITDLDTAIDIPSEWYDVLVKQLAARLRFAYGSEQRKMQIAQEANFALNLALGHSTSGESVYFGRRRT